MAHIRTYRDKWRAEVFKHGRRVSRIFESQDEAKAWAALTEAELAAERRRHRPRVQIMGTEPHLVTAIPRAVLEAVRDVPYKPLDVIAASIPARRSSGIYFLLRDREVVYVGQSLDVLGRLSRHRREERHFDAFAIIECEPEEMDRLERMYIHAFVPVLNLTFGNSLKRKPFQRAGRGGDSQMPTPLEQPKPGASGQSPAQAPENPTA